MLLMTPSLLTGLAALAAVLGLVVLVGRVATTMQSRYPRRGRRLALGEVLSLDTKRRLIIVQCDGREALLLTGGSNDALLTWLPAEVSP